MWTRRMIHIAVLEGATRTLVSLRPAFDLQCRKGLSESSVPEALESAGDDG